MERESEYVTIAVPIELAKQFVDRPDDEAPAQDMRRLVRKRMERKREESKQVSWTHEV